MKILNSLNLPKRGQSSIVTIGNFDGVHLGHQYLIKEVVKLAKQKECLSVVVTFDPHPRKFFESIVSSSKKNQFWEITPFAKKAQIIENLGVDILIRLKFDQRLANLDYQNFVEELVEKLSCTHILIGHDFALGKGRKGEFEELKKLSRKHNFKLIRPDVYKFENQEIPKSSTIRSLIQQRSWQKVSQMLGWDYTQYRLDLADYKSVEKLNFELHSGFNWKFNIQPKSGTILNLVLDQKSGSKLKLFIQNHKESDWEVNIKILCSDRTETVVKSKLLAVGKSKLKVLLEHNGINGQSDQLHKILLDKEAKVDFQDKVVIGRKAKKTKAKLYNRNLQISSKAHLVSKPELMVYNQDVEASHGSTTRYFLETEVNYLQTRGLHLDQIKGLLVASFLDF